ncbi:hypothetical protein [Actinokineospora inagensis]|uniref:hypothetical protein n=1 Tax=Actinokineospora inagensis TaxID=103730 RepID=UPI00041DD1DF|nr:hypothetical protein [Actinokineospora inagensis]
MPDIEADIDTVRAFLVKYYAVEPTDERAAIRARRHFDADPVTTTRVANAVRHVLAADLAPGTLQRLVSVAANRDLRTDPAARDFLSVTLTVTMPTA